MQSPGQAARLETATGDPGQGCSGLDLTREAGVPSYPGYQEQELGSSNEFLDAIE